MTRRPTPDFTVVVPLYNKRPFIRRAVNSVLAQSFSDFELVVVDDGSTDAGHEVLRDIADPRYRLVRQGNMGGAGGQARNTGLSLAAAPWVAFLDGDDMWLPTHLEELHNIIERYPEAGLVSTRSLEAREGASVTVHASLAGAQRSLVDYFARAADHVGFINCSTAAVRRAVFCDLGGFINVRSGPDLEYWARIALSYPVAVSTAVTAVYFRGNAGNMEQIASNAPALLSPLGHLRDLSPSVKMLCEAADKDPGLWRNPSVVRYVNARLWNAIRGALYRFDIPAARALIAASAAPAPVQHTIMRAALALLPDAALLPALRAYRNLKRAGAGER